MIDFDRTDNQHRQPLGAVHAPTDQPLIVTPIKAFTCRGLDYLDELLDHRQSNFMGEN